MAHRIRVDDHRDVKVILFLTSLMIGLLAATVLWVSYDLAIGRALTWGLLVAVCNPLAARTAVWLSELMHHGAFPRTYEPWTLRRRVWHGAFWPVTIAFWLVVFLFFISINNVFGPGAKTGAE